MGIIKLDRYLIRQIIKIRMVLEMSCNNVVHPGTDKEVFLLETQIFAFIRGIIRIDIEADRINIAQIFTVFHITRGIIARFSTPES